MKIGDEYKSGAISVVGAVLLIAWVGSNAYRQDLFTLAATYALIGLGVYLPYVLGGSLALAYNAYAAVGAYSVGLVSSKTGLPVALGWLAGPVVAATIAVVLGMATRRLSGFYLAAVTLLFSTAFGTWLIDTDWIGSSGGIGGIRALRLFGWQPTRYQFIVLSALVVLSIAFVVDRLRMSPWGVVLRTARSVPLAVESAGARVPTLNLVVLAIGAGIASLGGSLFATSVHGNTPETFTLTIVFLSLFMPLIGGVGTPWGAVLGAVIVVELTLNFSAFSSSGTLILSLGVIVILMVAPRGVLGYIDTARKQLMPDARARNGVR